MFRTVLIANRGEIALRVIRACHDLGVRAVVAHSEADRGAPWLAEADEVVCVGGARPAESYLDGSAILQAAEQCAAQAIHPGYGFLSENARFAAQCEQQGVTFIGPGARAIRRMGSKAVAKETMASVGVQTIPGSDGPLTDADQAREVARRVGYPVLLKAVSGGGGKGMRRADDERAIGDAYREASLEGEKAFGDPTLYLEKLVRHGRHIEFQILCDAFGRAIHLGERDCSIQRKHQKLVEEALSPVIDETRRAEVGEHIAAAVSRIGYRGVGTVEFLRDPHGELYFMEMNTRLQVEHPVTEMITGIDLVAQQLRVAANQPLEIEQSQVRFRGHAVEFRINAEDPDNDFRPSPGIIAEISVPVEVGPGIHVRWDSALKQGYRIPPYYDSMVGKLILHGPDRPSVLAGAERALDEIRIGGVKTSIGFHRELLKDVTFREGNYDIEFLASRQTGKA